MSDGGRLRALAETVVTAAGYDLEDFRASRAGRQYVVQVVVDGDDGLPLDAAAELSRAVSAAFDADEQDGDEAFGGVPYTLEVTSPGIGRPLTLPRHFARARGRLVSVTTPGGTRTVRVLGTDPAGEQLEVLGGRDGVTVERIPLAEISRARVEVDFSGPSAAVAAVLAADPRTADRVRADDPVPLDDPDAEHTDADDDTDDTDYDDDTDEHDTDADEHDTAARTDTEDAR